MGPVNGTVERFEQTVWFAEISLVEIGRFMVKPITFEMEVQVLEVTTLLNHEFWVTVAVVKFCTSVLEMAANPALELIVDTSHEYEYEPVPNVGRVPEINGVLPEQMVVVTVEIVLFARAVITEIATVSE